MLALSPDFGQQGLEPPLPGVSMSGKSGAIMSEGRTVVTGVQVADFIAAADLPER